MANEFKITPALLVVLYLAVLAVAVQRAAQEQSFFQSHDSPASIGLVIDISKSMADKKDKVVEAMVDLVKASNPQDQFFVIHFNDDVYLDQDFTQNAELVIEAVRRSDARGGTALNEAMLASADHLRKAAKYKRKILVLVGDGSDNESHVSTTSLLDDFRKPDSPVVYAIGLFRSGQEQRGRKVFQALATETGGTAFMADNPQKLNDVIHRLTKEIRSH